MKTLRIYVWTNRDGILVCQWDDPARIVSRTRVFLAGGPIDTLNDLQVRALIDLLYREPDFHRKHSQAIFYSGNEWAKRGCPDNRRGKILMRAALP